MAQNEAFHQGLHCLLRENPSSQKEIKYLVLFFALMLYIPVNSYGHVGTVSSPNHTFFLGKLD